MSFIKIGVQGEVESEGPSESECRPYIEKALKELEAGEAVGEESSEAGATETDEERGKETSIEQDGDENQGSDETKRTTEAETQEDQAASPEPPKKNMSVIQKLSIMISGFFQKPAPKKEESSKGESADDKEHSKEAADSKEQPHSGEEKDSKEEHEEEASKEAGDGSEEENLEDVQQAQDEESKEEVGEAETQQASEEEALEADTGATDEASEEEDAEQQQSEEGGDESIEQEEVKEEPESAETETREKREVLETIEVTSIEEDEVESKETEQVVSEEVQESAEKEESKEEEQQQEVDEASEESETPVATETEGESAEAADSKADDEESKEEEKAVYEEHLEEEQVQEQEAEVEEQPQAVLDEEGDSKEGEAASHEERAESTEAEKGSNEDEETTGDTQSEENDTQEAESKETGTGDEDADDSKGDSKEDEKEVEEAVSDEKQEASFEKTEEVAVEDLILDVEVPSDLRSREHVEQLLKLDDHSSETEEIVNQISEITLRELKKLYENAIKPLEGLYKYRDLSNRHFGDAEIFSKPLVLFMGPWSGGKSSIINYLVNNEYNETSLRTGAEPSPAYFNILMYGEEAEVLDGTELMADYTFSGLQKFGQGLEERLRGVKLPAKLLEKVNIVEIPGILEVRKQVSRLFPFNDACQWFIDRADIIFLVYDPSKLDVGPETEAILDQLKGREHQTRIVLNKADQVKPEELMRVQGSLIWNISPLMSSPQPPVMYTVSLWSRPYESWAPMRLLQAQERAFLRDLRGAIDKRIENKIASARRFAVRVRNHAKMVDCYLTTYYNHKSVFGNRKQVAEEIIEHPQNYHIYEGLSTLTNISRYDLPDPDVYRDFFRLNPLYEFQQLSATCTYFRGCPINRLDVAIAYDLPELVGNHKKLVENSLAKAGTDSTSGQGS
ncbi:unnamed protein product [Acanthoscelides obtectus]|uniref:Sarcalumenin n=1 Tax=Acanthoscelides obtectus TaxID=200917 RepID=A0A9P0KW10_ACAOB|nr:unnamed protein product [Acanthoscelides obtectus]CAK1628577.1 Sarcalumenin [Acanthoscelides obtectus]